MKHTLRQIAAIYKRDVQRLLKNAVALIVTLGIIIIPSLYAWFNIGANYDPYSSTSGIKVAVANLDAGTHNDTIGDLNAGASIVDALKENDQLGWTFTDEAKALEGVKAGRYYAAIVIPEDFSAGLTQFLSGKAEQAKIAYYVNEKKNAIAPKITDTGAQTLEEEIRKTFIQVASDSVSKAVVLSSGSISGKMDQTARDITQALGDTEKNLEAYKALLTEIEASAQEGGQALDDAKGSLETLKTAAGAAQDSVSKSNALLAASRQSMAQLTGDLSALVSEGSLVAGNISGTASSKLGNLEAAAAKINGDFDSGITALENALAVTDELIAALKTLDAQLPGQGLTEIITRLEAQRADQQASLEAIRQGGDSLGDMIEKIGAARTQLEQAAQEGSGVFKDLSVNFNGSVLPSMNTALDSFGALGGKTEGLLTGMVHSADQLGDIMTDMENALGDAQTALADSAQVLEGFSSDLRGLSVDIQALKSSDAYKSFLSLTGIDPDQVAEFMASPVSLKTEAMYPVANYGSALAPFYTNLAIWVGGIVLIAIFKLEVDEDDHIRNLTPTAAYFGRWLLYATIGLLQALVVCVGDIFIMGIQCESPGAFVATGLLASVIYVSLIYALSVTFKHVGKALSVILVILQIPGSAGTYPIEMTPGFFQAIHPLLPFTYGIGGMRECIAGIYAVNFAGDLLHLLIFLPIAFGIGLGIRPLLAGMNHFFDLKLSKTELMAAETAGGVFEGKDSVNLVARALAKSQAQAEDRDLRRQVFEAKYKKRVRRGFGAMFTLPVLFMILMFSVSSKMVFLVLWIVSIIVIAAYLILLEYFRDRMRRQLDLEEKMADMSADDILSMFNQKGRRADR
ncbi:MAG: YhgE/Pip domain-containing protein [Eubacterium sp.]|nr:YhgE/Pip domain-containing protein [Eubacterium sp.]